ncbi:AAA family ATPase [Nocardioides sp. S-58]|uniref:AAA family ATPase n=1 Tax=Nocardioides renjunii TaxID=3095075 RepID=A0ABU5KBW3_9ACTN|nr:AAA family ATPase [Nocardioides sp. S-58]MDZ5662363.1 AAA family ATPase [Nocardioides sp. S-58]
MTSIEGSVLVHCHRGCSIDDVLHALGLAKADLFDDRKGATYTYINPSGRAGRTVHRTPDKQFWQSGDLSQSVLYRLPQIVEAVAAGTTIFLAEGEKDVHALETINLVATTAAGGVNGWAKVDVTPLAGANVVAIVDRDTAGNDWAAAVQARLAPLDTHLTLVTASIGKDAADHVGAGLGAQDLIPYQLPLEPPTERATERGIAFTHGAAFILDSPASVTPLWGTGSDVLWAEGEALMLCGGQGAGKSSLAQQIVKARLGCVPGNRVLDFPVSVTTRRVLYLACDRPRQIRRSMSRMFTEADREVLAGRLMIWEGPPPYDLAKHPELLAVMCERAGADTVVIDSLKDVAIGLTEDEVAAAYNRSRQMALTAGIEVLELHHQTKRGAGGTAKADTLADVYGSVWLTAGVGSVIYLGGAAGDPIVEFKHLKQPAEPVGPFRLRHDHTRGQTTVGQQIDLVGLAASSLGGVTAKAAAAALYNSHSPSRAEIEKARRRLDGLCTEANPRLRKIEGDQASQVPAAYVPC